MTTITTPMIETPAGRAAVVAQAREIGLIGFEELNAYLDEMADLDGLAEAQASENAQPQPTWTVSRWSGRQTAPWITAYEGTSEEIARATYERTRDAVRSGVVRLACNGVTIVEMSTLSLRGQRRSRQ